MNTSSARPRGRSFRTARIGSDCGDGSQASQRGLDQVTGQDIAQRVYLEGAGLARLWPDLWPLMVLAGLTLPAAAWMFHQAFHHESVRNVRAGSPSLLNRLAHGSVRPGIADRHRLGHFVAGHDDRVAVDHGVGPVEYLVLAGDGEALQFFAMPGANPWPTWVNLMRILLPSTLWDL